MRSSRGTRYCRRRFAPTPPRYRPKPASSACFIASENPPRTVRLNPRRSEGRPVRLPTDRSRSRRAADRRASSRRRKSRCRGPRSSRSACGSWQLLQGWLLPVSRHAGAVLVTPRGWYEHHGIYVGDGRVVHYAGYCHGLHTGPVEEVSLEQFCAGHGFARRVHAGSGYTPTEIVERARSRIGERRYDLLANNCEHFCEWAIMGQSSSVQVERFLASPLAMLRRIVGGAVLASALALAGAVPAQAAEATAPLPTAKASVGERRVALVIGNARYPTIPLNNPENDARTVAATLRELGFEVTEHVNLPVRKFRQVLRDYEAQLAQRRSD